MVNIDHRYFHNSDLIALNKIVNGKVLERCDKKGEIIFGLNEFGKPATLISPRPRIGMLITDDLMNNLLSQVEHEVILKAMYSDLKLNDLVNLVD